MRNIISILMILASIIGIIVVIRPQYTEVQALKMEKGDLDVALGNFRKLQTEREGLLAQFKAFETKDLEDLKILLPDNIDNVKLILELDSLAAQFGLSLKDVDVVEDEKEGNDVLIKDSLAYDTVDIEFSAAGDYPDFVSFIESVETSLRLIDIYEITFQTPQTAIEDYEYNVKVRTYWLK